MGKILFGSTIDTDVNMNDWAGCCNPVCDVRDRNRGRGIVERRVSPCTASLSGTDCSDARTGSVLGSGGQPELEREPRVKKWPLGPSLSHKEAFLCCTGLR